MITQKHLDDLTYQLVGCAIEVHKELGPGLLESVYQKCYVREVMNKGLNARSQIYTPVIYKGVELDTELRLDLLVEEQIVIELKATEAILPLYEAQLLTYMKLLQKPKGLLINFNCTNIFKEGQRTMVNKLYGALPRS